FYLKILPTSIADGEPAYEFGSNVPARMEVLTPSPAVQAEMADHSTKRVEVKNIILAKLFCFRGLLARGRENSALRQRCDEQGVSLTPGRAPNPRHLSIPHHERPVHRQVNPGLHHRCFARSNKSRAVSSVAGSRRCRGRRTGRRRCCCVGSSHGN